MMTVHVTEAELVRDLHTVQSPCSRLPQVKGRKLSEVIAGLEASGANAVIDDDSLGTWKKASRPTVNHGSRHPGISPRFHIGDVPIVICALSVAELGHGIYRADSRTRSQ